MHDSLIFEVVTIEDYKYNISFVEYKHILHVNSAKFLIFKWNWKGNAINYG